MVYAETDFMNDTYKMPLQWVRRWTERAAGEEGPPTHSWCMVVDMASTQTDPDGKRGLRER